MTDEKKKKILVASAAAVFVVTLLVYLPSVKNGFVLWDDQDYVYENPYIRTLGPMFLRWVLGAVVVANWHPLTMLSHAVDYALWGLNPAGHHLTAIVIHSLNTVLVFAVSLRLLRGRKEAGLAALVAAFLFGLHPMHVESVTWVSERKDVLCAFFFLLSVLAYIEYAAGKPERRVMYYSASAFSFLLALLSKPMAISLPAVLLIIDYCPLERLRGLNEARRAVVEKIPFYILSLVSAAVTMWAQKKGGAIVSVEQYPFAQRLAGAFNSYVFYLYKTLLPVNLSPLYPLDTAAPGGLTVAAVLVFAAVSAYSVYSIKKRKIVPAVWLYYLITLFPVIGVIQVGKQAAADRYMYLPSIAPFILAGVLFSLLIGRIGKRASYAATAAGVVVLLILSALTVRQEAVWKDSITLWTYEIAAYPTRVPVAYYNRGVAYKKAGRYEDAFRDYTKTIELDPGFKGAYLNRGLLYYSAKDYASAIRDYDKAIELDPLNANVYINRGNANIMAGDTGAGIRDLDSAIRIDPKNPLPYFNLGKVYMKAGDRERGEYYLGKAASLGMK